MSDALIWSVIVALGLGSFALRYSFLGLFADRDMPGWLIRPLRYAAVAVLPGLVAPLVLWPEATGGVTDPWRLIAAAITLMVAYFSKNLVFAMAAGATALYGLPYLAGLMGY